MGTDLPPGTLDMLILRLAYSRRASRLRHRPTPQENLRRRTRRRRKLPLPRPAAPSSQRLGYRGMGRIGKQSPRPLLQTDRCGPQTTRRRKPRLRPDDRRHPRSDVMRLIRRILYFFRQRRQDAELAEEMDFHHQMLEQESGDRYAANRRMGASTLAREDARGSRRRPPRSARHADAGFGRRSRSEP